MKGDYNRGDLEIGDIVHACLYNEQRLGYITGFSKIDPRQSICHIDMRATFIMDITQKVTKEWYEREILKANPFKDWDKYSLNKVHSMMKEKVIIPKAEKTWEGVVYPEGAGWVGD